MENQGKSAHLRSDIYTFLQFTRVIMLSVNGALMASIEVGSWSSFDGSILELPILCFT